MAADCLPTFQMDMARFRFALRACVHPGERKPTPQSGAQAGRQGWAGGGRTLGDALAAHEGQRQHHHLESLLLDQRATRLLQPPQSQRGGHPAAQHVELCDRVPCAPQDPTLEWALWMPHHHLLSFDTPKVDCKSKGCTGNGSAAGSPPALCMEACPWKPVSVSGGRGRMPGTRTM